MQVGGLSQKTPTRYTEGSRALSTEIIRCLSLNSRYVSERPRCGIVTPSFSTTTQKLIEKNAEIPALEAFTGYLL